MPSYSSISIPANNLSGNPIIAMLYVADFTSNKFRIHTGIAYADLIYQGNIYFTNAPVPVDLSELFRTFSDVPFMACKISLLEEDNTEYASAEFNVYSGGISKILSRYLASENTDIFARKLKNVDKNFLLTTRTNSRTIYIPENELMPLYYYAKGLDFELHSNGVNLLTCEFGTATEETREVIDLNQIRKTAFTANNKLYSVFDVLTMDHSYCFSIVITKGVVTNNFLKFKNSWNVYELIALEGLMSYNPEFDEQIKFFTYDNIVSDFSERSTRKSMSHHYTAEVGYSDNDKRLFILDAIHSDDCTLIIDDVEYKVTITAEPGTISDNTGDPKNILLKISLVDKDDRFSKATNMKDEFVATTEGEIIEPFENYKILF